VLDIWTCREADDLKKKRSFNIHFKADTTYYLRIVCILPAITAPAITLPDHRAVYNARCGYPQMGASDMRIKMEG